MANTYTITLSDAEQKAMEYIAVDVNEWIQNVAHERARVAMEEMASTHVRAELDAGHSVSGSIEDIVLGSDLPNAQARHEEMMEQMLSAQEAPTKGRRPMNGDPENLPEEPEPGRPGQAPNELPPEEPEEENGEEDEDVPENPEDPNTR